MNASRFECELPKEVREELPFRYEFRPKRYAKIAVCVAIVLGLIGVRHLNTVPHRQWDQSTGYQAWTETIPGHYGKFHSEQVPHYWTVGHTTTYTSKLTYNPNEWVPEEKVFHPAGTHSKLLYTAESPFGSSYRVKEDGIDQGISYKHFREAFLKTFGSGSYQIRILHEIDR